MQILKVTEQIAHKNFAQNLLNRNSTLQNTPPSGTSQTPCSGHDARTKSIGDWTAVGVPQHDATPHARVGHNGVRVASALASGLTHPSRRGPRDAVQPCPPATPRRMRRQTPRAYDMPHRKALGRGVALAPRIQCPHTTTLPGGLCPAVSVR